MVFNTRKHAATLVLVFFLLFLGRTTTRSTTYNILDFGAKEGGSKDVSDALKQAWKAACYTRNGSTAVILIPKGRYLLKPVDLEGGRHCERTKITIYLNGTFEAPLDHDVLGDVENWISFKNVVGLSVVGDEGDDAGVLYARGEDWWSCKESGDCSSEGATSLRFINSRDVSVIGLKSRNSQKFHMAISSCNNVYVDGVTITADGDSPNTDGIHVQESTIVTIVNSIIGTGDDCISLGRNDRHIWIENIICGPGHGISIGSLGRHDNEVDKVQNVTVKSVTFNGTTNGARIKTWAKPSKGNVQDVTYQNITLIDVNNPIIIDQNYCEHNKNCPSRQSSSGIQLKRIHYDSVMGTSHNPEAIRFNCSRSSPCSGIFLNDVNITAAVNRNRRTQCVYANVREGHVSGFVQPEGCFDY